MSEVNKKETSKVETKRIRSRNTYDSINQIIETFNSSNGWALKKVNMIGMNIDVVVERSVDQASSEPTPKEAVSANTKENSDVKQSKEAIVKTSEPQAQTDAVSQEVVVDVDDAETQSEKTAKPTAKRGRTVKK